jgi:hypothetical protein
MTCEHLENSFHLKLEHVWATDAIEASAEIGDETSKF